MQTSSHHDRDDDVAHRAENDAAVSSRRPLTLLCAAIVALLIGDIYIGYRQSRPLRATVARGAFPIGSIGVMVAE
jgi:hypothetical protein